MTIPRANPLGWAAFELLTSAQQNTLDIHTTEALDGVAGGTYTLQTVPGRGDGYFLLSALTATAAPAFESAVMHIRPPANVANLSGLFVEVLNSAGIDQAMGRFSTIGIMASGGLRGLSVRAGGFGQGAVFEGGLGDGVAGAGGRGVSAIAGPKSVGLHGTGGDGIGGHGGDFTGGDSDATHGRAGYGIDADGGESTLSDERPGYGLRVDGGAYSGGDWTGGALSATSSGHGILTEGGSSDDTTQQFGVDDNNFAIVSYVGAGIFSTGGPGEGVNDPNATLGGTGGIFKGGVAEPASATSTTQIGGHGVIALGGKAGTGSPGNGIIGIGQDLDFSETTATNAFAGLGGIFYGGTAYANANANAAGHAVVGIGGDNQEASAGSAGHGLFGVGGQAGVGATSFDGNGLLGAAPISGTSTVLATGGAYIIGGVGGAGVVQNLQNSRGPAVGLVGLAYSRGSLNVGVFGLARVDNSTGATSILTGVSGQIPDAAGVDPGSAALRGDVVETLTDAYALDLEIPNTPMRAQIAAGGPTAFPTVIASQGDLFFGNRVGAGMQGSMFLGRSNGVQFYWSRVVDEHIPWIVNASGGSLVTAGAPAQFGMDINIGAQTRPDNFTIRVEFDTDMDDDLYSVALTENFQSGTAYVGRPVIVDQNSSWFEFVMLDGSGVLVDISAATFLVSFLVVGRQPDAAF